MNGKMELPLITVLGMLANQIMQMSRNITVKDAGQLFINLCKLLVMKIAVILDSIGSGMTTIVMFQMPILMGLFVNQI